jgi:seryl-tRNA synthetase
MDITAWMQIVIGAGGVSTLLWGMIKYQSNIDKVERLKEDNTRLEKEKDELKHENKELQKKIDQKNEAILNHLK